MILLLSLYCHISVEYDPTHEVKRKKNWNGNPDDADNPPRVTWDDELIKDIDGNKLTAVDVTFVTWR